MTLKWWKRKSNGHDKRPIQKRDEPAVALKAAEDSRLRAEADYSRQLSKLDESETLRNNLTSTSVQKAYDAWLGRAIWGENDIQGPV